MSSLSLSIEGMSCHHCLNAVNKALAALPGVRIESVRIGRAEVSYDPAQADADRIIGAVTEAGYRAHPVAGQ
ncbi:MAG TPA: cation transporter [Gemmatimonadales bacterium]